MVKPRHLETEFLASLQHESGLLSPLLERVKADRTLMLALRKTAINIYYRGGNLMQVRMIGTTGTTFHARFDERYATPERTLPVRPSRLQKPVDLKVWLDAIPALKEAMDQFFGSGKLEREFQQVVARENNHSVISNESEYFITDIEYAEGDARFDMLAIKWPRLQRRSTDACGMSLIEMKYGDASIGGDSGLLKHLIDLDKFLSDDAKVRALRETIQAQFNQLRDLGLIHVTQKKPVTISEDPPEIVLLLANHHPGSTLLRKALETLTTDKKFEQILQSTKYSLRFFVASFAGYGLHDACMMGFDEFLEHVKLLERKCK